MRIILIIVKDDAKRLYSDNKVLYIFDISILKI